MSEQGCEILKGIRHFGFKDGNLILEVSKGLETEADEFVKDGISTDEPVTDDDDYEPDAFKKYCSSSIHVLKIKHETLVLKAECEPDSKVLVCNLSTEQEEKGDAAKFVLQAYRSNNHEHAVPVALEVQTDNKKYYIYCTTQQNCKVLQFKEGETDKDIPADTDEVIFYQKHVSGGLEETMFESSLYRGWYLAIEEKNGHGELVLKEKDVGDCVNGVNETLIFEIKKL